MSILRTRILLVLTIIAAACSLAFSQTTPERQRNYPAPVAGDYTIKDFKFRSGETLPELKLHYLTIGTPAKDSSGVVRNAVLIMHGTGGTGAQFLSVQFANVLFGPGQLLDATKYFIILPDGIGHGGSSKPSDGLHLKFPHYTYDDMVLAQYRLITEKLSVNHLRLVMGTSMGGMHTWVWGETYPDFMDALMPLASMPIEIAGRNRIMRKMIMDSIRKDPSWNNGEYKSEPVEGLTAAENILLLMGSAPLQWHKQAPTRDAADKFYEDRVKSGVSRTDANDMLYYFDSSRDYNPSPMLEKIKAPLIAVNSADDMINPPELGVMEREIKRVKNGRYVLLPITDQTRGHGTHTIASVWQNYLKELLENSNQLKPESAEMNQRAPDVCHVRLQTTKGDVRIEMRREWAPNGVDRFYNLVRHGYYNQSPVFRIRAGMWAQFGINGDPTISQLWRTRTIPDDPRKESNVRGSIAFAFKDPNGRSTQVFINLRDNSATHDKEPFVPFAKVVEGMDVVDSWYSGYGETSGGGIRAGKQDPLFTGGNAYLKENYPLLDYIVKATVEE